MAETPDKQVFIEGTEEDVVLEKLGYQPGKSPYQVEYHVIGETSNTL